MVKKFFLLVVCGVAAIGLGCSSATTPNSSDVSKVKTTETEKVKALEKAAADSGDAADASKVDTEGASLGGGKGGAKKAPPNQPPQ